MKIFKLILILVVVCFFGCKPQTYEIVYQGLNYKYFTTGIKYNTKSECNDKINSHFYKVGGVCVSSEDANEYLRK